jgi:F-type H+-transporting ATPase subunit gamma
VANTREVKRRIKSVNNTRQITRTMELVATSKLKRATDRVEAATPYAEALKEIVWSLYAPAFVEQFPLLRRPEREERVAILLMTANRGLAGGFNANLIKEARDQLDDFHAKGVDTELHIAGKKGISYFRFRGHEVMTADTAVGDVPTIEDAERLVAPLRDRFVAGELDGVYLVASQYQSALTTPPGTTRLLPIEAEETEGGPAADTFLLSPSAEIILSRMLPMYVRNAVFTALVENAAAEQAQRRTAMKNATDNAGDVLEHLTRTYNRARQAQITQEIAEIVGGAAGLS